MEKAGRNGKDRGGVAGTPTGVPATPPPVAARTDWYAPGQSRTVVVDGVEVTVRFVGRKGRRARIAITASAKAVFQSEAV